MKMYKTKQEKEIAKAALLYIIKKLESMENTDTNKELIAINKKEYTSL